MTISSDKIKWYKPFIVLLIVSHLLGCTDWVLIKKPPDQSIIIDKPEKIKIKLNNGDKYIIHYPIIEQDTLFGGIYISKGRVLRSDQKQLIKRDTLSLPYNHTFSVSVNDIKEVQVEKDYTGALPPLIFLGIIGGLIALGISNWGK